jgi:hypothetical protein
MYRSGYGDLWFPLPTGDEECGEAVMADDLTLNRLFYADNDNGHRDATLSAVEWLKSRRETLLRPEASWRRMFAVQPPARTFVVDDECCTCQAPIGLGRDKGSMDDDDDDDDDEQQSDKRRVRLGTLYGMVIYFVEQSSADMCSLDWFVSPQGADGTEGRCPEPAVIVRNGRWKNCSVPEGAAPWETGVRVGDFDKGLVRWYDGDYCEDIGLDLNSEGAEGEGGQGADASDGALHSGDD